VADLVEMSGPTWACRTCSVGADSSMLIPSEKKTERGTSMARTRKATTLSVGSVHQIDPNLIDEDPNQPRQEFDQKELDQLVQSVGIHGVIQPLEIIPIDDGRYRLVAGARRRRAALLAGLKAVP